LAERDFTEWELCYRGWDPAQQPLREALMTLGNGHFATRGAAEEAHAGGPHYPGTYLGGGYDRLDSEIAGKVIQNEDLVNWPNWLPLTFRCEEGDWFALDEVTILDYEQRLNVCQGLLIRRVRFRDRVDREFRLESRRLVHMEDEHLAAIEWVLTPLNWSGKIQIRSAIDGRVTNSGVARYRQLNGKHLQIVQCGQTGEDAVFLVARTRQSHLAMAQAVRTRIAIDDRPAAVERRTESREDWIGQDLYLECETDRPVRVEKVLSLYSSRDFAISEPRVEACEHLCGVPGFGELRERHELAWRQLWHRADLELLGREDPYAQFVLRLHLFHLLQTASMNTIGRDVGIPARGLHGEAYRGHIFWDELFTVPYLNLRLPELTRSLLLYRYRRLPRASRAAAEAGYKGVMFPWQSGSDGREENQVIHLNPESGRWLEDNTHRQRHVNAAIAYNIWQYYQATGDMEFLSFYGAEMLLGMAQFWASIATYNRERERYEIHGVVGPDEFHTSHAGTEGPGLINNAYTNVMAVWVLQTALATLDLLAADRRAELLETLRIADGDLRRWDEVSRRMYVPFLGGGIISQFEGWEDLQELDWDGLKRQHGDIQRLDRILEAEDRDPNDYKATKQADVLMLLYLFSADELTDLFARLGYEFDPALIPKNVKYYLARTSHGSSLSRVVHAWVLARMDRKGSWDLFHQALAGDFEDVQGGTTPEGVHLGAMGSSVDFMQRCYTGLEMRGGVLWLNPRLPDGLAGLKFSVRYRGHWLVIQVDHHTLRICFQKGWSAAARIGFRGQVYEMEQGEERSFDLAESEVED
jgi:trehalose/maltose hydrolase-like predicted phosphorylase